MAKSLLKRFQNKEVHAGMFDGIQDKRSRRPEIHALLLLDSLLPGDDSLFYRADNGELLLDFDEKDMNEVLTDDHIEELIRCGVVARRWSGDGPIRLYFFVN